MAQLDIRQTDTTDMANKVTDFSVTSVALDRSADQPENYWDNSNYEKYNGYYFDIPEYGTAIDAFATWVLGKGYTTDAYTQPILDNIKGWGEDTFQQVLWNAIVTKKVQGDSFSEILRNEKGTLVNLKPLGTLRIITNAKGKILRYEQRDGIKVRKFQPNEIFHISNNRYGDQIHGTPTTRRVQWVIDARNEAMRDFKRILHRSTIRIMYVDEDDTTKLTNIKKDYADAIKNGELLILPKGVAEIPTDLTAPQTQHIEWIRYLENFFYQALGVPKVILGGSEEFTEASSKISYLTYEQVYTREVVELEADIWNQLAIRLTFNKPASLKSEMLSSEDKNTGQVAMQPNDMMAGVGA